MENGKEKLFGLALGHLSVPLPELCNFLDFPHFKAIELPAEAWLPQENFSPGSLFFSKFERIDCASPMDPAATRAIVREPERSRSEFADAAALALDRIAAAGAAGVSMDFALNDILGDREQERALREILRRMAPVLHDTNLPLLLPFRIPARTPECASWMMRFLRETLIPQIKVRLDVHPYELPPEPSPRDSAGTLYFETASVVFSYDADSGCRILKNHVEPWIGYLERTGFRGPYYLAPASRLQRMARPEGTLFDEMAMNWNNR